MIQNYGHTGASGLYYVKTPDTPFISLEMDFMRRNAARATKVKTLSRIGAALGAVMLFDGAWALIDRYFLSGKGTADSSGIQLRPRLYAGIADNGERQSAQSSWSAEQTTAAEIGLFLELSLRF